MLPGQQAAIRNTHQAAQGGAREATAIVGNILKLLGFLAAKNIAAFLRNSRGIRQGCQCKAEGPGTPL